MAPAASTSGRTPPAGPVEVQRARLEVDAHDRSPPEVDVALLLEDVARSLRDVVHVQPGRGDLVEQRLKRVVVVAVDDRDVDRLAPERLHALEPAVPHADDHDAQPRREPVRGARVVDRLNAAKRVP